jgi:hypothetical protein
MPDSGVDESQANVHNHHQGDMLAYDRTSDSGNFRIDNDHHNPCKTSFPHIQQEFNWDCGLVACRMILKWCGCDQSFSAMTQRCPTRSTWSIDLAYLLHGLGFSVFFKLTLGRYPKPSDF